MLALSSTHGPCDALVVALRLRLASLPSEGVPLRRLPIDIIGVLLLRVKVVHILKIDLVIELVIASLVLRARFLSGLTVRLFAFLIANLILVDGELLIYL